MICPLPTREEEIAHVKEALRAKFREMESLRATLRQLESEQYEEGNHHGNKINGVDHGDISGGAGHRTSQGTQDRV